MQPNSLPRTIQIFLPYGDPPGIGMAVVTTRTVRVFDVPRSLLSGFLSTSEASQVGLYFLFGGDSEDGVSWYIEESGNVGGRLRQHVVGKDFSNVPLSVAVSLTNTWTDTPMGLMEWKAIFQTLQTARYPC